MRAPQAGSTTSRATPETETPTLRPDRRHVAALRDAHRRAPASTCSATPPTRDAVLGALRRARRARPVSEAAAEILRVEHGRPRYGVDLDDTVDPAGGRAERARGELHQGLLRRPGDGRAPVLQGQAQPPPARPAPVGAASRPARSCTSASGPSGAWAARVVSPALGPIALALVRREAEPGSDRERRRARRERRGHRAAVRRALSAPQSTPRGDWPIVTA